ncbi:MAG: rRNA (guanosine2251-2-O)-methyltransferase [Thermoleophilaceae bacterium]|nr:rRNA (guanosine2251-2-O)-methyltransferase [Thermoleophilaceae bacterium]
MIVYGRNPVREALRGRRTVARVWASERTAREPWLSAAPIEPARDEELASLCGSADHQGVCAEVSEYPYAEPAALLAADDALVLCLDQVTDPRNLGAVCRVAEVAGAAGVVIGERRSAQVTPVVCRASAGAVEHLPLARVRNLADYLADAKQEGAWVYGASTGPEAVPYDQPDYRGRVVLVLGSEGRGLRPRVAAACDQLVVLPVRGRVESLNVSAAAAALVYGILHFVRPGLTGFHKPGKLARTDKA